MKSLQRNFKRVVEDYPELSSLTCFSIAVAEHNFSRTVIMRNFNKLVDHSDYQKTDKKAIIEHLYQRTLGPIKKAVRRTGSGGKTDSGALKKAKQYYASQQS